MIQRWRTLEPVQQFGILLLSGSLLIAIFAFVNAHGAFHPIRFIQYLISDYAANISSELIGIALTVLIIDRMNRDRDRIERRQRELERQQEEKKRLIRQMRSVDNGIAVQAAHELRAKGWHEDGSLKGTDLHEANLSGVDLSRAMLIGASLTKANLFGANLERCELNGAMLNKADLRESDLDRAVLEKAFLIEADLSDSSMERIDLTNALLSLSSLRRCMLRRAILRGTDLTEADLRDAFLEVAEFDTQTTLPDGSKWTPQTDLGRFTNPRHEQFWRSDNPVSPAFRSRAS
ncbi:MAG: pentapeptide repeat-containing protein [Anaerolineae bacterium]|jgi:uncharacterized protein YjbI with pentapeptide repeats|nr:pentapeptide repeat-containing protein [Anaerolineae bacterium]